MKPEVKKYLSEIGTKGGRASKRILTPDQAREMVRAKQKKRSGKCSE